MEVEMEDVAFPLACLRAFALARNQIALLWLGQSSFALRVGGAEAGGEKIVLLDPFLSPHPDRLAPPSFPAHQAVGVDAVLCTHEHLDHFDVAALRAIMVASPHARLVVPRPIVALAVGAGISRDRVIGAQPGEPVALDGFSVHPIPAMHGVEMADAYTFGQELSAGLYRYLGYVVETRAGGVCVYHAGDTIPYGALKTWLNGLRIDVALLPINGRDAAREARNLVGNLDHREAAHLAVDIGADVLIPMHYDLIATNLGYPDKVVDIVTRDHLDLTVVVLARERPFIYTGLGPTRLR